MIRRPTAKTTGTHMYPLRRGPRAIMPRDVSPYGAAPWRRASSHAENHTIADRSTDTPRMPVLNDKTVVLINVYALAQHRSPQSLNETCRKCAQMRSLNNPAIANITVVGTKPNAISNANGAKPAIARYRKPPYRARYRSRGKVRPPPRSIRLDSKVRCDDLSKPVTALSACEFAMNWRVGEESKHRSGHRC
jgi:hypothetical protein